MDNLKRFLEAIEYKVSGGAEYCWKCYGPNARFLDGWSPDVASASCVYDTKNQTVYEIRVTFEAGDYRGFVWHNPDFVSAYDAEAAERHYTEREEYARTDCLDDILAKTKSMMRGEEFDTRVVMALEEFEDDLFLDIAKRAHARDITFNQMVEELIRRGVEEALNSSL